jgi:hypothetical protein
MNLQHFYSERDWIESAGHFPLSTRPPEDLALLHRHWIWADQMRDTLDGLIGAQTDAANSGPAMLASPDFGFMFAWYAMLSAVIEACVAPAEGRSVDLRGPFRSDIQELMDVLRRFRNAILHVPRAGDYVDDRLTALVIIPTAAVTLRRIHFAFGRLFLDEFARREASSR